MKEHAGVNLVNTLRGLSQPLPPDMGAPERVAASLLAALSAQLLSSFFSAPAWLLFGLALERIWSTFPLPQTVEDSARLRRTPPTPAPRPDATTGSAAPAPAAADEEAAQVDLPFTPSEGAQLLGSNEYVLNYSIDTVISAALSKYDVLPCPEAPEMLKVEVLSEEAVAPGVLRRKREFTTENTLPGPLANFMGVGPTVMTDEESLEKKGDHIIFITENREMQHIAHLQVHELFRTDPANPSRTLLRSETWMSTPGLYWPLTTTMITFARSKMEETVPLSRRLLEKRCAEISRAEQGIESERNKT